MHNFYWLGRAYVMLGRYDEAVTQFDKAHNVSPVADLPFIGLAIAYSLSGREEDAQKAAAEVISINPKFSIAAYAKTLPYKKQYDKDTWLKGLRQAGLPENPPLLLPDKPSIAVLPFENMSGDTKEDYFSDGLTEQIITSLASYPRLFVIARQSSFYYKGKPVKVQQVAEELGVRYVLEGSVQKSGDKVRITAQLIDASTGHHILSERYDRELKDIFDLQDEITINVMNGMVAELTEGEQARRWTKRRVANLKALEKHYRAQGFFCRHTKEDYEKARPLFEEAIALEPEFVWPYVYLGYLHSASVARGWSESPAKSLQTAFELAQKALAIDDSHDGAHSLLAGYYNITRQHDKALSEAERAIALNPNASDAYMIMGSILGNLGKWEESALYAKKSIRINPFPGAYLYYILGRAYFMTGQYDESIATWKKALKVSPNFLIAHRFLAACYSSMGRDAEASAAAKEVLRINPKFTIESYAKRLRYKDKVDIEREVAALRKAGLPE
jgi:adenylate cyclase